MKEWAIMDRFGCSWSSKMGNHRHPNPNSDDGDTRVDGRERLQCATWPKEGRRRRRRNHAGEELLKVIQFFVEHMQG